MEIIKGPEEKVFLILGQRIQVTLKNGKVQPLIIERLKKVGETIVYITKRGAYGEFNPTTGKGKFFPPPHKEAHLKK